MNKEKVMLHNTTEHIKKYFIGEAAMHIIEMLQEDCISDTTRYLIAKDGYDNAYNALAHQHTFGYRDSSDAIMSEIRFLANTQFTTLPGFVRNLMEYECPNPKENRLHFSSNVFQKAVTLICNDTVAAKREEEKQLMYEQLPF